MYTVLLAVVPIFILLILGNLARRSGFLSESFWEQAEKGTYYVLFPALLIAQLAQADLEWRTLSGLALGAALLPVTAAALSLPFKWLLGLDGADFTSFFQGAVRFNTYIGLAVAVVLPGPALAMAALILAVMIPVVNVLCVLAFALFTVADIKPGRVLLILAKNPLIMACLLGVILNSLPFGVPPVILDVLNKLGQMALPLGLLSVGAGLRLKALRGAGASFLWVSLFKLALLPLVAWGLGVLLGLEPVVQAVLVLFAGLPTASSAYILARQLGGNATLMAGFITVQTVLSVLTLPLVLLCLSV